MNYKKALKRVKSTIDTRVKSIIDVHDINDMYYVEWMEVMAESLEKQIPKQVKKVRQETILGYAVIVHCPNCGGSVWQNADESKYCFRCGQKLDWEANK